MIKLGIVGAMGRMGKAIATLATEPAGWEIVQTIDKERDENSYAALTGINHVKSPLLDWDSLKSFPENAMPQVLIDFSSPQSTLLTTQKCIEHSIPLVVGTTGFSQNEMHTLQEAGAKIPLLISSNMSIGVNLLFKLTDLAARTLAPRNYDIEAQEIHHKHKKDAPSGTSRTIEKILLEATDRNSKNLIHGREGIVGARPASEIGSFALRGGDVVGEHTVYFFGDGERIEIKHTATSRNIFATGALNAAKWILGKQPKLYSMNDVLKL